MNNNPNLHVIWFDIELFVFTLPPIFALTSLRSQIGDQHQPIRGRFIYIIFKKC